MEQSAYLEVSASQKPAIELFQSMGYIYISPKDCEKQRGSRYHVLLKDILRGQLRKLNRYSYAGAENEFSAANIERAMEELDEPLTDGLVRTSEKIYDALLLGKSYPETVGGGKSLSFNLKYIDWEHLENNLFHVTEEFAVDSLDKQHNARPDIVLFINGIPFVVIECKAPHIPVEQAVEQAVDAAAPAGSEPGLAAVDTDGLYAFLQAQLGDATTADCLNKIMANRLPTRITALAGQSGDQLVPSDLTLKKRAGAENCYDFSAALLTATDSTAAAQVSGTITMVKEDGRWKASAITLNL